MEMMLKLILVCFVAAMEESNLNEMHIGAKRDVELPPFHVILLACSRLMQPSRHDSDQYLVSR